MELQDIIDVNGPNRKWGQHQVEVVFQSWDYRNVFVVEVGGNSHGTDVLDCAVDRVLDKLSDLGTLTLTAPDGDTLLIDESSDSWTDRELRDLVVSVRIVGYVAPTLNAIRARNCAASLPDGDHPHDPDASDVAKRRAARAAA